MTLRVAETGKGNGAAFVEKNRLRGNHPGARALPLITAERQKGKNTMNPKVSVVVPFYNVAGYLPECAESVLSQTLEETELILVDDGSDDGSEKIAEDLRARYPERVRTIHQPNRGPSAARNAGMDVARGEYLYFLDSDDRLKPHALAVLYSEAAEKNLDIVLLNTEMFTDDPALQEEVYIHRNEFVYKTQTGLVLSGKESLRKLYEDRTEEFPSPVWTRFYRRQFAADSGVRFPEGVIHEDEDFCFFTYLQAKRVEWIPDVLLERRFRRGSIMQTKTAMDSVRGYRSAFLKILDLYGKTEDADDRMLLARHSERLVFYTLLYFSRGDAASCAACRTILDPFIADARTLAPFYCETVRRAMDWYEGRVPDSELRLPEIHYLCYVQPETGENRS